MTPPTHSPSTLGFFVALGASALAQSTSESPEPNGSAATASPTTSLIQSYGNLSSGTDVDFWSFELTAVGDVTAYVTTRGARGTSVGGSSLEDSRAVLYGTDGVTVLDTNDDYSGRAPDTVGRMSRVRGFGLEPGTYFVAVSAWSVVGFGDYGLDILTSSAAAPLTFCGALNSLVETEPNSDAASASPLACCSEIIGAVAYAGDEDFCELTLAVDSVVSLETHGDFTFGFDLTDSQIWVFAADGATVLGIDDDDGDGFMSQLEIFLASGVYFVAVRGFGSNTGGYRLTVDCAVPAQFPVFGDFHVEGTGCVGSGGEPLEIVTRLNDWPQIGSVWAFDVYGPGSQAGFLLVGLATFQPTLDLGVIGAPGCELWVDPAVVLPMPASSPSEFEWTLPIPLDPIHVGGGMVIQALALDAAANDLGLTSSNRLAVLFGNDG